LGLLSSCTALGAAVLLTTGAAVVVLGLDTAVPNWSTTNDLICRGVGRAVGLAVVVGLGLAVVVVGLAVVLLWVVVVLTVVVVGLAVVVVGLAVVLAVVVVVLTVVVVGLGLAVVVCVVTGLAGRTTELALLAPLDLEDSTDSTEGLTVGLAVRIWTKCTSSGFSSGRAFFLGWFSFLLGRKKVSENLSAVRAGAAGWTGSLTGAGAGRLAPNL